MKPGLPSDPATPQTAPAEHPDAGWLGGEHSLAPLPLESHILPAPVP